MPSRVLVVPSIREQHLKEFLAAWSDRGGWDAVVLVEDNPEKTFDVKVDAHYSWKEIAEVAGSDAWIFSRRDSAIRAFGFLAAWRMGAEYVATLDDDCFPISGYHDWFGEHVRLMNDRTRWTPSIPGLRTRGLPYRNLGAKSAHVNMGLWENVADYDSVQTLGLLAKSPELPYFTPPSGSWIVPAGQYAPVCGMNLCFRREAAPLVYFPLMGEGQTYRRFDDIWMGVVMKKVADHLGWWVTAGEPHIEHRRASDPMVNLVKEAPGVAANEWLWGAVDAVPLSEGDAADCVAELGAGLRRHEDGYVAKMGEALGVWARFFIQPRA